MNTYFKNQFYIVLVIDLLITCFVVNVGYSDAQILLANLILGIAQLNSVIHIVSKHHHNGLIIYLTIAILLIITLMLYHSIAKVLMITCFIMAHIYVIMLYKIQKQFN